MKKMKAENKIDVDSGDNGGRWLGIIKVSCMSFWSRHDNNETLWTSFELIWSMNGYTTFHGIGTFY
jgi:hypothetical protein